MDESRFVMRDLKGYANHYPDIRWPGGARVAVSVVLNIEEGAELLLSAGDERNEAIHEAIQQVEGAPDLCLESHFEYGSRVGYWRICELADHYGVPLTLNACARALEATPWVGEDAAQRGYEIQCHGWRWESHAGMDALDRSPHADHWPRGAHRWLRAGAAAHASEGWSLVCAPRGHRALLAQRGAPEMKLFGTHADLPLDARHAVLACPDGQGAPSSKDIFGTEHKLEGRVALRPQDVPPQDVPPVADDLLHQLDATRARAGLRRSPGWPARNTTVWHH